MRESTKILDFLGIVGGFAGSLELLFAWIGSYFSAQFLRAKIAQKLYVKKRSQSEMEEKKRMKFRSKFS